MTGFIKELRRREVFRTAGLYVGICWILIEAGSVVLPSFGAPDWLIRGAIIVAIAGFPVMLVLAWFFDVSTTPASAPPDADGAAAESLGAGKADFVIIGVLLVALVLSLSLNVFKGKSNAVQVDPLPITALLTQITNTTGDARLDGVVEEALITGFEVAPHVDVIARADHNSSAASDLPMGNPTARENFDLLLSATLQPDDDGYRLSVVGEDVSGRSASFDVASDVDAASALLTAVGNLSAKARKQLGAAPGDAASDGSAQSLVAASVAAADAYASARRHERNAELQLAADDYAQAVKADPQFGLALARLALTQWALKQDEAAAANWTRAQALPGTITERDRLRLFARYYSVGSIDDAKAAQTYATLVEAYPADLDAREHYAAASFRQLAFSRAVEQTAPILQQFPAREDLRVKFARYARYASDWETLNAQAELAIANDPSQLAPYLQLAVSALKADAYDQARDVYARMAAAVQTDRAASLATLGLADIDLYLGLTDEARAQLLAGIDIDTASGDHEMAALKYVALAQSYAESHEFASAKSAAGQAAQLSNGLGVQVTAAIVSVAADDLETARVIANALTAKLDALSRANGQLLLGMILEHEGESTRAILAMRDAVAVADSWLIRFQLAQAYLRAGNDPQALDELTALATRRGEASAVFLDDMPTYRLLAQLPYWSGRVQQALNMRSAAQDSYARFNQLRPQGSALAQDAQQRLAGLQDDN
ncbi:MAG: hypothetical protein AAFO81_01080 [Pseudomonadota bacterium]